jgi:hypothetical protein
MLTCAISSEVNNGERLNTTTLPLLPGSSNGI